MGEWEAAVYIEGRRPKCCWRPKGLVLRDEMGHSYSSFHILFFFFFVIRSHSINYISLVRTRPKTDVFSLPGRHLEIGNFLKIIAKKRKRERDSTFIQIQDSYNQILVV